MSISNSNIINNRAAPVWSFGEGYGGGVYSKNSIILIDSCEIAHNIMSHGGGGVYSLNSEILIKNSVIYDNHAESSAIYGNSSGGGVFVDGGQAQIVNNTISFNSNQGYGNSGGGITIINCEDFLMENTNITNNSSENGGGIYFGSGSSGSKVKYSDFHDNFQVNFGGSGIPPDLGIITTTNYNGDPCDAFYNIFLDPHFVDEGNGNFHLQANSPCIDAGDPTFPNDPDSTIADIGRFFFDQSIPVELVSFTAKLVEDIVLLEWITATETNNLGFEIQRKPVNAEWENVGFVQGHGTTTESQSYRYSDNFDSITANSLTYRLKQIDFDGSFKYSDEVLVREASPIEFTLEQNYPNPFNPSTTIKFSIPEATTVTLTIYNVLGERVTELVNSKLAAGRYSFRWNAQNVATGMYIYELRTSNFVSVKKTILIK